MKLSDQTIQHHRQKVHVRRIRANAINHYRYNAVMKLISEMADTTDLDEMRQYFDDRAKALNNG